MTELTILMPCLNEAETLAICIRRARAFLSEKGVQGEVMIADNGSTDGSQDIADKEGAVVVNVTARGYGAALLGGIEASDAKYIIMSDADDSYDFSNLMPFIEMLRAGADVVVGNRFRGGVSKGAMPFLHRFLGNPVLSFLGRLFFRIRVGDFHCGLRGFNRESVNRLNLITPGMEFASEMIVKAALGGQRIEEVPTTLRPDGRSRPPHLRTWRDGWRHLRFLLIFSPRYLYLAPGFVMLVVGFLGALLLVSGPKQIGFGITLDVHSFIAFVMLTVLAIQVLLFGAITEEFADSFGIRRKRKNWLGAADNLEAMLLIALMLFLVGLAGAIWCFAKWASIGYQPLAYDEFLRPFVLSLAAILVAAQMSFTSFFAASFSEFFKHAHTSDKSG